jgi:DNA-binding NarL/FixJ family response regulator
MEIENKKLNEESSYFFLKNIGLSHREIDVVKALLVVKTDKEIAEKLNIAASTVHSHKTAIYSKTNTNDRASLILYLVNKGFFKE